MPKPVSLEQKLCTLSKKLGITLAQLKVEIDAGNGNFRREFKVNRNRNSIELVIRCRHPLPEAWAMSMLHRKVCIACIDFHKTDYTDEVGIRRIGWHRDVKEKSRTIKKVRLSDFKPESLDQFIIEGLAMFNVLLSPGGDIEANGQMQLDPRKRS